APGGPYVAPRDGLRWTAPRGGPGDSPPAPRGLRPPGASGLPMGSSGVSSVLVGSYAARGPAGERRPLHASGTGASRVRTGPKRLGTPHAGARTAHIAFSTSTGSMRVARRAGHHDAMAAAPRLTSTTAPIVSGSLGST